MRINGRAIGRDQPPYIIAELSANHNGNLEIACKAIEEAAKAGADAVKLQTYTADTITLKSDQEEFRIKGGIWHGRTLYELYEEAHTPWEWHQTLFAHARMCGITIFSSPFDKTAADLLTELRAPAFKIASFEAIDLPLIRYVAGKGKPMIISTGMANLGEIGEALQTARDAGCDELALLHCVSGYPAPAIDYNLATLVDMGQRFGVAVGLSDHTICNVTAIAAVALGATVIEKHFTLNRNQGGPDASFSLEPEELHQLCRDTRVAWEALGTVNYGLKSSERANSVFRRSLYAVQDIPSGALITEENVRSIRPGFGLEPKHLDRVIGLRAKVDIKRATALSWSMLNDK